MNLTSPVLGTPANIDLGQKIIVNQRCIGIGTVSACVLMSTSSTT
jgi:hypothetical protein